MHIHPPSIIEDDEAVHKPVDLEDLTFEDPQILLRLRCRFSGHLELYASRFLLDEYPLSIAFDAAAPVPGQPAIDDDGIEEGIRAREREAPFDAIVRAGSYRLHELCAHRPSASEPGDGSKASGGELLDPVANEERAFGLQRHVPCRVCKTLPIPAPDERGEAFIAICVDESRIGLDPRLSRWELKMGSCEDDAAPLSALEEGYRHRAVEVGEAAVARR